MVCKKLPLKPAQSIRNPALPRRELGKTRMVVSSTYQFGVSQAINLAAITSRIFPVYGSGRFDARED